MTIALAVLYTFVILAKAVLALRQALTPRATAAPATVVQPILSGDPLLRATLERNLDAHPEAPFLWMVDEDDAEALRIADALARPNLRTITGPPPRNGENPKLAKLIRALDLVTTPRLIVLDDDTFFPGNLSAGALVTGLPVFQAKHTIYERLIGGFVNGGAVLTYLPAARLNLQRSINGMIYSVDTAQLRQFGGFAAAGHELTDDYAVARLYLRNGQCITQATAPAFVAMTVTSALQYIRVMRRWMIFASCYFGDNATLATAFWIGLPSVLPLIGFVLDPLTWAMLLLTKAVANRVLLWRITGAASTVLDILFECAADLLTPLLMLLAFITPSRLTWRSRKIEMQNGVIRYR